MVTTNKVQFTRLVYYLCNGKKIKGQQIYRHAWRINSNRKLLFGTLAPKGSPCPAYAVCKTVVNTPGVDNRVVVRKTRPCWDRRTTEQSKITTDVFVPRIFEPIRRRTRRKDLRLCCTEHNVIYGSIKV